MVSPSFRSQAADAVSSIKSVPSSQDKINTLHQILTGKPAPSKRYTPPTVKPRTLAQTYGQFLVPHSQRTAATGDDGGGFLSALGGLAGPALGLLAKPLSIASSTAKELIDFTQALAGKGSWSDVSARQWASQIGGLDDYYSFGKLLRDEDWLQDSHLTQLTIPGVGWKWDVNASFLAAAPFDIALDPLAWITFGLGKTAQVANVLKNTALTRRLVKGVVAEAAAEGAETAALAAGMAVDDATRAVFRETAEIFGEQAAKGTIGDTVAETRNLINNMLNTPAAQLAGEGVEALPAWAYQMGAALPTEAVPAAGRFFSMGGRPLAVEIGDTVIREVQDIMRASAKMVRGGRSAVTSGELNTVAKAMQRLGVDKNIMNAGEYAFSRAARDLPEKGFKPLFDVGDDAARKLATPRGMVKNQLGLKIPGTGPIGRPVINKLTRPLRNPRGWDEMTAPIGISLLSGSSKFVDDLVRFIPQSTRKLVFGVMGAPFRRFSSHFGMEGAKVRDIIKTSNNPALIMSAKAVVRSFARGNAMTRKAQAELSGSAVVYVDTVMSQLPADLAGITKEEAGVLIFKALEDPTGEAAKQVGPEALGTAQKFWASLRERAHELAGMEFIAERPNYVPHQPTDEAFEFISQNFNDPNNLYQGGSFTPAGFERGRGYIDETEWETALIDWAKKNHPDDFGEGGWQAIPDSKQRALKKEFRASKNAPTDEFMHEKLLTPGQVDEVTGDVVPGVAEQIAQIMRRHGITHELFDQNAFTVIPQYVTALSKRIGDVHIEKLLIDEGTLLASWTTAVDIPTVQMAAAAATMRSYSRKVTNAKRGVNRAFLEANTGHISADKMNTERFRYAEAVWKEATEEYERELEIFEELQRNFKAGNDEYLDAVARKEEIEQRIVGPAREIQGLEDEGLRRTLSDKEVRRLAALKQEQQALQSELTALDMGISQAKGYQDGIYYGLWRRAASAVGTKLFIERSLARGFGSVERARAFADEYADEFQRRLDQWRMENPDQKPPPDMVAGTTENNSPRGLMDDWVFDPEGQPVRADQGEAWMAQVAEDIDNHHIGEWIMLQDVDQFIPQGVGVYGGASSAVFSGLEMIDDLAKDYLGQLDRMVAKYSSMAGMPDLPAPLKRYRMPTQEQLNEATNLIVSYNEMGPLERANFALRRTPPTQVGYRAGMGMQNLQEDLADALRMHFAVYGGDNLIHIKNLDDLDVLASQYGEALRQRSGWLEEVIQESPIAQLEMAVPNPMVSAAQTMGLDTYATLLQFRDRMSDAIQNGAGVRMRLGASLEEIETSGTLLTQEDLLGYGIRVDGAGDPLNVAGVIHSEINEGLKTTFHIMPGGRIYAVQTPTGPKGLRNAYHAAIGSALHRELGLATDNIALEFADTGVPVVLREIEPVAKWNDEFQISMHTEGVAGRTLALDVDGNVRALTPDEWRTRQSLRAQTVIDPSTGEILRREPRVTRAVNSDVELMESLIFDLLTGSPNPYGRGMTNYRLTRYGSYSRAGFGGSFDELTPPARGVGEPPVTPDGPPAITRKARRAELEQLPRNKLREIGEALAAAAGEKRPSPKKKPKWIGYILRREFRDTAPATPAAALPDRPIAAEEAAELDLSKVVLKEELKPKKPTPRQASYVRVVEEVLAALNKWEALGLKAGGKREMGKVGKRAWADALNEAHPELFGQSGVVGSKGMVQFGRGRSPKIRITYRNIKRIEDGEEVIISAAEGWKRLKSFTEDYLERLKIDPEAQAVPKRTVGTTGLDVPEVSVTRAKALQEMTKPDLHEILIERNVRGWTKKTSKDELIARILISEGVKPGAIMADVAVAAEELVAKGVSGSVAGRRLELEKLQRDQLKNIARPLKTAEGKTLYRTIKKPELVRYILSQEFPEEAIKKAVAEEAVEAVDKVPGKSLSATEQALEAHRAELRGETPSPRQRPPEPVEAPPNRALIEERRAKRAEREVIEGERDPDIAARVQALEELPPVFPELGSPGYPGIESIDEFRSWIAEYDVAFQDVAEELGDSLSIWESLKTRALRSADAFEGTESGTPLLPQKGWGSQQVGTFTPEENPMFPELWESAEEIRNFVRNQGFNEVMPDDLPPRAGAPAPGIVLDAPEPKIVDRTLEPLTYREEVPKRKPAVRGPEGPTSKEVAAAEGLGLTPEGKPKPRIFIDDGSVADSKAGTITGPTGIVDKLEEGVTYVPTPKPRMLTGPTRKHGFKELGEEAKQKILALDRDTPIHVGDEPSGADRAFQDFLKENDFTNVTVHHGQAKPRYNAGFDTQYTKGGYKAKDETMLGLSDEVIGSKQLGPSSRKYVEGGGKRFETEKAAIERGEVPEAAPAPVADAAPRITRKVRREELGELPRDELARLGRELAEAAGESRPKNRKKGEWIRYIIRREFREGAPEATPAPAKKLSVPSKKKFFDMGKRGNLRAGTGVDLPGEPQASSLVQPIVFAERPELTILERGRINGFTEEDIVTLYLYNEQAINILDFNGNKDWGGSARRRFGLEDLGPPKNKADLDARIDRAYKKYIEDFENAKDPITERTPREQLPTDEEIATRTGAAKGLSDREIEAYQQYKVKRAEMDAAGKGVPTAAAATPPPPAPVAPVVPGASMTGDVFGADEIYLKGVATRAKKAAKKVEANQKRQVADEAMADAVAAAENLDTTNRFRDLFDALGYVPTRQMQDVFDSYGRALKLNDIELEEKIIAQIDKMLGIRGKYGSWQNFIAHHTGIGQENFFAQGDGVSLGAVLEDRTRVMAELVGLPFYAANSDELLRSQAARLLGPEAEQITQGMDRKNLLDLLRTETGGHGVETRATAQSPHIQQPGIFFGRVGGVGGVADVPWIDGSAANYTVAVDGYLGAAGIGHRYDQILQADEFSRYSMNVGGETPLRVYGVHPWMQAAANESVRGMSPSTQRRAAGEVLSGVTKDDPMVRPEGTQFPAVLAQEAKGEIEQMIPAHIRGMTTLGEIATDMLDRIHPDTFDELLHFADPATTGRKYTRATREAGRRHTDYTVNVDAYEALMTRGFVDRSKVPPVGGKKYPWVGIEGEEEVKELTLREIHRQIWKDPALGNEWARQWGLNHVHGAYGEPWQWTIPYGDQLAPRELGAKGAGFDPQRAAVNSVRLARIWSTTPAIANRFRRPGMDNSVFQEIMLFIGWRDQTLWKQSIQGATPPALGPLVQITPTQLDDIDTLISKYLNATSPTTNADNWGTHVLRAHEGATENSLGVWRAVYNNYFIAQARRQQVAGRGLPKELLAEIKVRGASPEEMRDIFSSFETMSRALIRSDLAGFPEDSLISKAFEQFHLSLAADGYSGFAWPNATDNYALTPFVDDFNLGAGQGFERGGTSNLAGERVARGPDEIGNVTRPSKVSGTKKEFFVNVVPTNPLSIHAAPQVGDLVRGSATGEWDQVLMGNMVDPERYMEFFEKQALHALESAPTKIEDVVQITSPLEQAIAKEMETMRNLHSIQMQMERSLDRLQALGADQRFPQHVRYPDEYLISQGITDPQAYPEVLDSGWMSASKARKDAIGTVLSHARERIEKFQEARAVVQRLRSRVAGETPQGQPIETVGHLAALQDAELAELRQYVDWVNNLEDSVRQLAIQDTKEINLLIDLLGSEEYSTAKEILGNANDLVFTNRFGDPFVKTAVSDVIDQNFRAGWRPVGVRSQGPKEIVEAMLLADRYRGQGGATAFGKWYDKAHNVLKGYMIFSPGFFMRNFYGGMFMNWLAGVSPMRYAQFSKAYKQYALEVEVAAGRASEGQIAKLVARQGKVSQEHMVYVRELADAGAFGPGQASTEFTPGVGGSSARTVNILGKDVALGRLAPWSSRFMPLTGMRKVNMKVETVLRGTIGFDRLANGGTLTEAFDDIYKFHFDYDDLSRFERRGIKRVIPFYTWTRHAIPLMVEQYAVNPVPFHRYMQAMNAIEAEPGTRESQTIPQWLIRQGGVPTDLKGFGQGGPGQSLFFAPDLPMRTFYDVVNPMFKSDMSPEQRVGEGLRAAASMVTPLIKGPAEVAMQRNIWKGYNFDGRYEYVPSAFTAIPGWMKMLETMGFARRTPNGEWAMQDAHLHGMAQLMPPFSQARRLFPDEKRYQERWLSTWASFVFGLGVRTNTEYEQQMEMRGRVYRARDEVSTIRQLERIDAGKR